MCNVQTAVCKTFQSGGTFEVRSAEIERELPTIDDVANVKILLSSGELHYPSGRRASFREISSAGTEKQLRVWVGSNGAFYVLQQSLKRY
mmetsp:Transcript_25160/g.41403  ORF Transcript_25160/g.41403 Transcript_25160/m.41403 type:complete len:90 (+) Transcript_25160:208-477(+)